MGKRSVGLQKDLSVIFHGVRIPGRSAESGQEAIEAAQGEDDSARLNPIAIFERVAREKRRRLVIRRVLGFPTACAQQRNELLSV